MPTTLTFDLPVPRRPSIDDLGGAQKENEVGYDPDPISSFTADDFNQTTLQVERLAALSPAAVVAVHVASSAIAGVTAIGLSTGANAPTTGVLSSAFTVTRTAAGKYRVAYGAGVVASNGLPPCAHVTYNGATSGLVRIAQAARESDGVYVQTFDAAGAFVDCDFVVVIY